MFYVNEEKGMFDSSAFDGLFKLFWVLLVVAIVSVPFAIWKVIELCIS